MEERQSLWKRLTPPDENMTRQLFLGDDLLIVIALGFCIAFAVLIIIANKHLGIGPHAWALGCSP